MVSVLGVPRRCVNKPNRVLNVVDEVAHTPAAGHLVFPRLQIPAIVAMRGEISAQPMLAVVIGARTRVGAQDFEAAAGVGECEAAQFFPAVHSVTGAEADVPFVIGLGER